MAVEIVRARPSHLEEIAAIEEAAFPDPWSRGSLGQCINGEFAAVLTAEEDGHVAGFAIYNVLGDEAELYTIAVAEPFRRRGVGLRLLTEAAAMAARDGAARMFLEVRRSNGAAQALYRRAGFSVCGVRRRYYDTPREDAILMDIELGDNLK